MALDAVFSSEIWIAAAVGSISTAALNWGYRRISSLMQRAKSHSVKWIRVWYFRRVKRRLLMIQVACEDAIVAQRELSRCATYHTLFLASIVLFPCAVLAAAYAFPEARKDIVTTMIVCSVPIYAFEIPWMGKSKFLDDLTGYRKRKRDRANSV